MSESTVELQPDSTGSKIRTNAQTVSGSSVHAQVIVVGDPATTANLASVTAAGAQVVDGSASTQPVSGTFWQATQPVSGTISAVSAATITSIPTITVTAMNAGTVTSATITAALPAGTNVLGGVKIYDPNGNTAAVVTASSALKIDGSAVTQPVSGTVTVGAGTVGSATIVAGTVGAATITAAIPTGANVIGAITKEFGPSINGASTAVQFKSIANSASGDNTIVTAVASHQIRVLSVVLVASGAVNCKWESANSATPLSGPMNFAANGGYSMSSDYGLFETASGAALVLNLSSGVQVDGHISYIVH